MKTKRSVQIAIGFCFALLCSCGLSLAQSTTFNYMPGTNFSQFHTFKWVTIPGGVHPNQIVDQEIQNAVVSQLAAKGLTQTNADNADLYVGYQCAVAVAHGHTHLPLSALPDRYHHFLRKQATA